MFSVSGRSTLGWGLLVAVLFGGAARAQSVPWDTYADQHSSATCDLVNAGNAELVVLSDTGELVVVTGTDVAVVGSFVDADLKVFLGGTQFGVIDFATDGDNLRTLWWLTLTGTVVDVDPITLEPSDSGLLPSDFTRVPCDACPLWDVPLDCGGVVIIDTDSDGVPDVIDQCPDTPSDEVPDSNGCSCSQRGDCLCDLDTDNDGVADCNDQCPNTPDGATVDTTGCSMVVVQPSPIFVSCGNTGALTLAMMFCGLASMRFIGRRPRRI